MIEVEAVSHRFGALQVLDGVTFRVPPGTVFGFVGPNGAGKTTTLRMMATLLVPEEGRILVGGEDVAAAPQRVRELLGFMPDGFGVYPNLTVGEYLDFFAAAYRLPPAGRPGRVAAVLELTDLAGLRERFVDTLSKGMTQRLGIARMLLHEPEVLVLDEPANGLDPRARVEMRELLHALRDLGKTIVLSSHILRELGDLVDEVAILERGRVVAAGPLDQLSRSPEAAGLAILRLRFAGPAVRVRDALGALPEVRGVDEEGPRSLRVAHQPGEASIAAIVRAAVEAGAPPVRVEPVAEDLEGVFLKLTRGELQ